MQNNLRYINLSWAVVAICEDGTLPLSTIVHDGQDEVEMVEHYVIGYMAFWHIAFVDEDRLVPCRDDALRTEARKKIDRYIADHPPVETFPRFYLVLPRQPIAPMEPDGMSCVYQMGEEFIVIHVMSLVFFRGRDAHVPGYNKLNTLV